MHQGAPLRLVALYKLLKAALSLGVGLGALRLLHPGVASQLEAWLDAIAPHLNRTLVQRLIAAVGSLTPGRLEVIAAAAFVYVALFTVEGVGLWRARRWAGYLTILTTLLLVPLEVYALTRKLSITRMVALGSNLVAVGYLIDNLWRSRGEVAARDFAGRSAADVAAARAPALDAFAAFEREGWSRVASGYAASFGRCTSLAIQPLLDAVRVATGVRVLDLACGPGYAAAAATARGATAAGLDFSAPMVARARAAAPGADVREGDAAALPWPDGSFDAVVCNFGFNHFPDVERALAEARRVLAPGGRLAFTVWDPGAGTQRILNDAIAAHGAVETSLPAGPPAHRFADPAEARRVLAAAGFRSIESRALDVPLAAASADEIFEVFRSGTVRLGALIRYQNEADLIAIRAAFGRALEPYRAGTEIVAPMRAILTSAEIDT